jgi:NDP-sugar pyrophosphorylase family protein
MKAVDCADARRAPEVAVIMCGGRGRRLGPLGEVVHKALLPVAGAPVVEHVLCEIADAGVREVWMIVDHLASQLTGFIGNGARFGLRVRYKHSTADGTAGALATLADDVHGPLVYCHANVYCSAGTVQWLAREHLRLGGEATFLYSARPEAPSHPQFVLDGHVVRDVRREGPGPYSVGRAVIDARALAGIDGSPDAMVEEAVWGTCAGGATEARVAVEYPCAWCHLESLEFYRELGVAVQARSLSG